MSYKVTPRLKEQTITLMEDELNKKATPSHRLSYKGVAFSSLSVAAMIMLVVSQSTHTQVQQLNTSNNFEFHSENTTSEVVELYHDEYEMHLAKIKEHTPDYQGVIFGDDHDNLTQEEREEINRNAAKRDYQRIIENEARLADRLQYPEEIAKVQEKFDSMELANPLQEWKYVSLPYIQGPYDLYGTPATHRAYDLAADMGTPIYAMGEGVVTIAGEYTGSYGHLVEIDHGDGVISRYAHCSFASTLVKEGDIVQAGQQIASVGTTGNSTGPHLHFETRYYYNPFDIRLFDFEEEHLFNFE